MMMSRPYETAAIALSLVMFVGTLIAIPIIVVRMPADHFVRPPHPRPVWVHVLRNVVGAIFVALGIAMLVLPGQGLLTILLGLSILDLPIKHRVMPALLRHPKIAHAIQAMRARAHRPPLVIPEDGQDLGARDGEISSRERSEPRAAVRPDSSPPSTRSS